MKLRPEIKDPKYWIHLVAVAGISLWILNTVGYTNMPLTLTIVGVSAIAIGIADILVHTLLGLD